MVKNEEKKIKNKTKIKFDYDCVESFDRKRDVIDDLKSKQK